MDCLGGGFDDMGMKRKLAVHNSAGRFLSFVDRFFIRVPFFPHDSFAFRLEA